MTETQRNELLKNGSGYTDITAYLAMKNLIGGGAKMMSDYKDGDIVTVEQNYGEEREMLILKCHQDYATATMLKEFEPRENSIPVISRDKMYIDAGRTGYIFYDKITGFVKSLPNETVNEIRGKIAVALGLKMVTLPAKQKEEQEQTHEILRKDDIEHLEDMIQELADKVADNPAQEEVTPTDKLNLDKLHTSLIRAAAERDVYKELYEKERGMQSTISIDDKGIIAATGKALLGKTPKEKINE